MLFHKGNIYLFKDKSKEKEFKGTFNVRISPESHRKVATEAAKEGITLNQFVADAINERLKNRMAVI
ncbi:MAG: toxin-antitoxin system HicB family antitoxin [Lachnospiraceae bacterium]|nr:toxin-antitoxin system HicB family antitoxin [Lachnospiraceae bacterium]